MAYTKKTWIDDELITTSAMNNIENGIEAIENSIPKKISQLENDLGYVIKDNSIEHVIITEAEYEALTEEEKDRDDILYIITDAEPFVIDTNNFATKQEVMALIDRITELENIIQSLQNQN